MVRKYDELLKKNALQVGWVCYIIKGMQHKCMLRSVNDLVLLLPYKRDILTHIPQRVAISYSLFLFSGITSFFTHACILAV